MDLKGSNLTKGKDCFKLFNRGVVETLEIIKREQLYTPSPQKEENIILAYDQYYSKVQSDLGHYFKTLFCFLPFDLIFFLQFSTIEFCKQNLF